jgi:transcriptional regulator with XRE-family HTH domain
MTSDNGRAFNEWLRAQLKAKKMSQRQLAQQSGVDHSTISRLIRGDRMPSLGTATKLARGLREIREDSDTSAALGVVSVGPQNPTARVEYALRADEALSEPQVRQIMEYYLAVRVRRFSRAYGSVQGEPAHSSNGSGASANGMSAYARPAGMANGLGAPTVLRTSPPPSRYGVPRPAVRPARTPGRP